LNTITTYDFGNTDSSLGQTYDGVKPVIEIPQI
jgi:hypothetical protein